MWNERDRNTEDGWKGGRERERERESNIEKAEENTSCKEEDLQENTTIGDVQNRVRYASFFSFYFFVVHFMQRVFYAHSLPLAHTPVVLLYPYTWISCTLLFCCVLRSCSSFFLFASLCDVVVVVVSFCLVYFFPVIIFECSCCYCHYF